MKIYVSITPSVEYLQSKERRVAYIRVVAMIIEDILSLSHFVIAKYQEGYLAN